MAALDELLDKLGIERRHHEHPPVFTVDEARAHWAGIEGAHTKNLLLKDGAGVFWLVVMPADMPLDLKALPAAIGSKRLSFASAEALERLMGIRPGSVSPLALINDRDRQVRVAIERGLMQAARIGHHPLRNDATVTLAPVDLLRFLDATGHPPLIFDAPPPR